MKIHWLLFAIVLLPYYSGAQSENGTTLKKPILAKECSRFSLGVSYSPEVSYRFLGIRKGENESIMRGIIDSRNEPETFKFGHTAGVQITYDLNKKISLESGISYTMFGEKTKPYDLISTDINGLTITGTAVMNNSYHYVSVPLTFNYSFGSRALKYVVSSGISASIAVGHANIIRANYPPCHYSVSSLSGFILPNGFNRVALGAHIAVGFQYHFSSKFSIRVAPVFRMTATSVMDAPITEHYFNAGLETGVQWRL